MSDITTKLKEPFENQLSQQLLQLELANAELKEHKATIDQWPEHKKKISNVILKPMKTWAEELKKYSAPFNLKKFKRAKRRLSLFKRISWSSWNGFKLGLKMSFFWIINLLRILLILSFFIGLFFLVGFVFIKVINFIGGLF